MYLDIGAKYILEIMEKAGHTSYAVGGCVRDTEMGIPASDYDIATPALPQQTEQILGAAGISFFETGLKHGTITAVINGKNYEITTFRTESGYSDNRRPDCVNFVKDLEQDLKRRDFTICAMAYNPQIGVVDLFGGRHDISDKIIRTVGDPDDRFREDALRILRALRFSSVLGFDIEADTARSVMENAYLLSNIADERITCELLKILEGKNFLSVLEKFRCVFELVLPGIDKIYDKHAFEKFEACYSGMTKKAEYVLMLLGSVFCKSKSEIHLFMHRLKLSANTQKRIITALENAGNPLPDTKHEIKTLMSELGFQTVCDLVEIRNDAVCKCLIKEITDNAEPYTISQLNIDGNDIIEAFGISGKRVGEYLKRALRFVIQNPSSNKKEIIMRALKKP